MLKERDRKQNKNIKGDRVGRLSPARLFFVLLLLAVLLNVLGWKSRAFCDIYIRTVFRFWGETYGRVTGLFPFSLGEFLLGFEVCLVAAAVLLALICGIMRLVSLFRKKAPFSLPGKIRGFFRFFAWESLFVVWIMTLNCFLLYHATPLPALAGFASEDPEDAAESAGELLALYNKVATECNSLSLLMERDENGFILYSENSVRGLGNREDGQYSTVFSEREMQEEARRAISALSSELPHLYGYYPHPKALLSSDFMCQQYMLGYYFPFSLEANYNNKAYVMNLPVTLCHELSHLKGYIYEDEANFIGYLACVRSDNVLFRYSGYLSVLSYLWNDLNRQFEANPEAVVQAIMARGIVPVSDQVAADDIFVIPEEWERIEEEAIIETETVHAAADTFIDTNLKINGVSDGKISYSRVVELLLQYERKEN